MSTVHKELIGETTTRQRDTRLTPSPIEYNAHALKCIQYGYSLVTLHETFLMLHNNVPKVTNKYYLRNIQGKWKIGIHL